MKAVLSLTFALLVTAPAAAAELNLPGLFGTPAGCAIAQKNNDVPDGKVRAVDNTAVWFDDAMCPILETDDPAVEGDVTTWQIKVSCEAGHEEAQPGTLKLAYDKAQSVVNASVVDGVGPKGKMELCEPAAGATAAPAAN